MAPGTLQIPHHLKRLLKLIIVAMAEVAIGLHSPLHAAETPFPIEGSQKDINSLQGALRECQALSTVLNTLRTQGKFSAIHVVPEDIMLKQGPFRAAIAGTDMLISPKWIEEQSVPAYDVRNPNEILPNNICFGLGHLASHLGHPEPLDTHRYSSMDSFMKDRLNAEARAFLAGWNFAMKAAIAKNHGTALNNGQIAGFLLNLQYRSIFFKAIKRPAGERLTFPTSGLLAEDDQNIQSIVEALQMSNMADIE